MSYDYYGRWKPYVSVAERRRKTMAKVLRLKKKGETVEPIQLVGRTIARTFWGKAWCDNLESYSDYANRLPRGRTYVRNGSVIDLKISEGRVNALVQGSSLYKVDITISPVEQTKWKIIVQECSGKIDSLVELLQGRLSTNVMSAITNQKSGLFPSPKQINLKCSCPDWAEMCKHVAAALYGVGARLDLAPELLFSLRKTNHLDLITVAGTLSVGKQGAGSPKTRIIEESSLSSVFGIELDAGTSKASPKKQSLVHKPVTTRCTQQKPQQKQKKSPTRAKRRE